MKSFEVVGCKEEGGRKGGKEREREREREREEESKGEKQKTNYTAEQACT